MITFDDEMQKLSPARRAKIEAKTQELQQELKLIREIRQKLGLSQEELAERIGVQQPAISKLEKGQQTLTLGKLTSVVTALGGEWEINLKFPDRESITITSSEEFAGIPLDPIA